MSIKLIVGLANPGPEYEHTRHNAGAWFIHALADDHGVSLRPEKKFLGIVGTLKLGGSECRLLIPTTYMNLSGQAIGAMANYFKIQANEILVVHDELDLPPGSARLKKGGGTGGHNGLKDTVNHLHSKDFYRLRLGIGHPGKARDVVDYVLHRPSAQELERIETAIDAAYHVMPLVLRGEIDKAMQHLHTNKEKQDNGI